MEEPTFQYEPACSSSGCLEPPRYVIAAPWSHGPLRERKNYGLACDRHREDLLARALGRREALLVRDDEQVGPVDAFPFTSPRSLPSP